MLDRSRAVPGMALMALAASLAACGGDGGPTVVPTPAPTPAPCAQTVLFQESGPVPARTLVILDFSVPDSGRLDVTLDWTNASSQVGFYLVPANTCTIDEFNARSCNFLMRSETTTKPRKISSANFAAGNYRWMIGNFATADESVALQIVLSKGDCPAPGPMPAAYEAASEAWPDLQHATIPAVGVTDGGRPVR